MSVPFFVWLNRLCDNYLRDRIQLNRRQKTFFDENGYLLLEQVLPDVVLNSAQMSLEGWVDDTIADWKMQRLVKDDFLELDFETRLYKAWLEAAKPTLITAVPDMSLTLSKFSSMVSHESLLSVARQLLHSDDVVPLVSSFFRAKLPQQNYTSIPWHQDAQCLSSDSEYVTLWIPLVDINEGNACLEIGDLVRSRGMYPSCTPPGASYVGMRGRDISNLTGKKKILMQRGDVLCFHKLLPHRSVHNDSDRIRWSLDVRFEAN